MSEIKWIKITTNMFEDEKINFIESLPESDTILIIWIKLLALAGKINAKGYIFLTENIPYTEEMLAHKFRRSLNTVRLALETFQKLGMIETDENGLYISNWEKHQNIDGMEKVKQLTRERVRKHRENQKLSDYVMNRDNNTCQYCGNKATGHDHVIPTARGGKDTDDNKVACCLECNRIKNDKPLADFLNSNRNRINDDLVLNNSILRKYVTLCNVTDRYNVTQSNAIDIDKELDKEIEKVHYQKLVDIYHEICISYPKVLKITPIRKKHINARLKDYTLEDYKQIFLKAESSDFMKGKNDNGWKANFDWLLNENNVAKVLEGKYDNKTQTLQNTTDELEELKRRMGVV